MKQFGGYCLVSDELLAQPDLLRDVFTRRLDRHAAEHGMKVDPDSVKWGEVHDPEPVSQMREMWYKGTALPI